MKKPPPLPAAPTPPNQAQFLPSSSNSLATGGAGKFGGTFLTQGQTPIAPITSGKKTLLGQ